MDIFHCLAFKEWDITSMIKFFLKTKSCPVHWLIRQRVFGQKIGLFVSNRLSRAYVVSDSFVVGVIADAPNDN